MPSDSPTAPPTLDDHTLSDGGIPGVERGTVIGGRYEIVRLIGSGGMGAVYEARHVAIRRQVALKLLRPEIAVIPVVASRFIQEARSANDVRHRNIVDVSDFGIEEQGRPFLVMEYLSGEPLSRLLARERPLPVGKLATIMAAVVRALAFAHSRGVVHRDIKPDNIFLAIEQGTSAVVPKVLDFGIAKSGVDAELRLTTTGAAMGTPLYMAPEQAGGSKDVTPAADQYAVGCILYEALTQRTPHIADNYNALIVSKVTEDPTPIAQLRPDLDPVLASAIMRTLARTPGARFASLTEFLVVLEPFAPGGSISLPPSNPGIAIASTLVQSDTGPTPQVWEFPAPSGASSPRVESEPLVARAQPRAVANEKAPALPALEHTPPARRLWVGLLAAGLMLGTAFAASRARQPAGAVVATTREPTVVPAALATPTVTFTLDFTPDDAEIFLDGVSLGMRHAAVTRPRDGRPHELRVTAPGYDTYSEVLTADGSARVSQQLTARAARATIATHDTAAAVTVSPAQPANSAPPVSTRRNVQSSPHNHPRLQVDQENPL